MVYACAMWSDLVPVEWHPFLVWGLEARGYLARRGLSWRQVSGRLCTPARFTERERPRKGTGMPFYETVDKLLSRDL